MIDTPENLIKPEVELIGNDGNAFAIIGACSKALRKAGNDKSVVDAFTKEATSGDYNHLLATANTYCEVY
jgi:hypothetical protein